MDFNNIYHEYKHLVYNLTLQYVQHEGDAKDITQDVFLKIYTQQHKYDSSIASVKTWIYRITINQCLDFIKAKKNKERSFIISLFSGPEANQEINLVQSDHPGVLAEDKEEIALLFKAINKLQDNQRTVIILTHIEGYPQKEVAEIMRLSVKAVESLLQRARQKIKNNLKR